MSSRAKDPDITTDDELADVAEASDANEALDDGEIDANDDPADDAVSEVDADPASSRWEPAPPHVVRFDDHDALADAAAKRFLDSAERAVAKDGQFIVVLAGGSTPRGMYRRLTESPYRERVPWDRTFFVFGDERCVAPDHEDSNYRMVRETLFDPLEIPALRVLRMKGEQKPEEAARRYEVRLGDLFLVRGKPRFDMVILGIGADGHTASLFPGTAALEETSRWVVANHVPQLDATRLTLTLGALNATGRVLFLATGEDKAQTVAEAFGGLPHEEPHPCERVTPRHGRRDVFIDHPAAARIP